MADAPAGPEVAAAELPAHLASLTAFLERMRVEDGLRIGTREHARAQTLVAAMIAQGRVDAPPERWAGWLAPLVCKTPREQHLFHQRYVAHAERERLAAMAAQRSRAERAVERRTARGRRWTLLLGLLALPLLVGLVWLVRDAGLGISLPTVAPGTEPVAQAPWYDAFGLLQRAVALLARADRWLVALLPLAILGAALSFRRRRRRALTQAFAPQAPEGERLGFEPASHTLFEQGRFRHRLQGLKSYRESPGRRLDAGRTVRATARAAGRLVRVTRRRRRQPEYTLIVERATPRDLLGALAEVLGQRLETEQVVHARYTFSADPRVLVAHHRPDDEPLHLTDLSTRHPELPLVILSDGSCFLDPRTGDLWPWAHSLRDFDEAILLTPVAPAAWGERERVLAEAGLVVLPATSGGLEAYVDLVSRGPDAEGADLPPPGRAVRPYPASLRSASRQWVGGGAPPPEQVERLLHDLRAYLGPTGFELLSACAIFPGVHPAVTIALGEHLRRPDGHPLLDEAGLLRLARLPWFRQAAMPAWLRLPLVRLLPPARAAEARDVLQALLLGAGPRPDDPTALDIARRSGQGWVDTLLDRVRGNPDSPLRDQIFLAVMRGEALDALSIEAPRALDHLLRPRRDPVEMTAAAVALLAAAALWVAHPMAPDIASGIGQTYDQYQRLLDTFWQTIDTPARLLGVALVLAGLAIRVAQATDVRAGGESLARLALGLPVAGGAIGAGLVIQIDTGPGGALALAGLLAAGLVAATRGQPPGTGDAELPRRLVGWRRPWVALPLTFVAALAFVGGHDLLASPAMAWAAIGRPESVNGYGYVGRGLVLMALLAAITVPAATLLLSRLGLDRGEAARVFAALVGGQAMVLFALDAGLRSAVDAGLRLAGGLPPGESYLTGPASTGCAVGGLLAASLVLQRAGRLRVDGVTLVTALTMAIAVAILGDVLVGLAPAEPALGLRALALMVLAVWLVGTGQGWRPRLGAVAAFAGAMGALWAFALVLRAAAGTELPPLVVGALYVTFAIGALRIAMPAPAGARAPSPAWGESAPPPRWAVPLLWLVGLTVSVRIGVSAELYPALAYLPAAAWLGARHGMRARRALIVGLIPAFVWFHFALADSLRIGLAGNIGIAIAALLVLRVAADEQYRQRILEADTLGARAMVFLLLVLGTRVSLSEAIGPFQAGFYYDPTYLMATVLFLLGLTRVRLRPIVVALAVATLAGLVITSLDLRPPDLGPLRVRYDLYRLDHLASQAMVLGCGRLLREVAARVVVDPATLRQHAMGLTAGVGLVTLLAPFSFELLVGPVSVRSGLVDPYPLAALLVCLGATRGRGGAVSGLALVLVLSLAQAAVGLIVGGDIAAQLGSQVSLMGTDVLVAYDARPVESALELVWLLAFAALGWSLARDDAPTTKRGRGEEALA
ncbi:MAG: hypothetical protein H6983_04230 [Ectothiorhodospiraceae bacterium]|nr:hypothetical protein [Ectothiorhodospiraceae bacterium]